MDTLPEVTVTASRTPALPVSSTRQPRGIVQLNGQSVTGWRGFEVTNGTYFEADSFRVDFAVSDLPDSNNAAWFAEQSETFVEIFAGFPSDPESPNVAELTSLIYGRIDNITYDPVKTLLSLTGRDLTGAFIDKKLTADYPNKTSSQIVTMLINGHAGILGAVTKTTTNVGTYYAIDQVQMQADRSEWDLICYLARQEGFIAYMSGKTLVFGPDPIPNSSPYQLQWIAPASPGEPPQANVKDLSLSRSQTISKGISVTVRSYNGAGKANISQSYPTRPKSITPGKASPYGATQQYYFRLPAGSTPQQCQAYAEKRYHEIVEHEMKLEATLPGDVVLTTKTLIRLSGTGTKWDQSYYPKSITREMNVDVGFTMNVSAQNQNTDVAQ